MTNLRKISWPIYSQTKKKQMKNKKMNLVGIWFEFFQTGIHARVCELVGDLQILIPIQSFYLSVRDGQSVILFPFSSRSWCTRLWINFYCWWFDLGIETEKRNQKIKAKIMHRCQGRIICFELLKSDKPFLSNEPFLSSTIRDLSWRAEVGKINHRQIPMIDLPQNLTWAIQIALC